MLRLLTALCLGLLAAPALAQPLMKNFAEVAVRGEVAPEASANSYALIIANSAYDAEAISDLAVTANDARAMQRLFLGMGYPQGNVALLENLDRDRLEEEVLLFAGRLRPDATVVVYYSGHGLTFEGDPQNYLVPVDMDPNVGTTAVALRQQIFKRRALPLESAVLDILKSVDPAGIVVFYDACRNAPFAVDPDARKSVGGADSFVPARVDGTAIFYSAKRGQESIARLASDGDEVNLSLYTRVLVSELSANPAIRLRDLHPLLNGRVAALAREGTNGSRSQDPSMEQELDYSRAPRREFCLASVLRGGEAVCTGPEAQPVASAPAAAPAPVVIPDVEGAFWAEMRARHTPFHYRQYLQSYPQGAHAAEARTLIAQLEAEAASAAMLGDWQVVQQIDSIDAYRDFAARYPGTAEARLAAQFITLREAELSRAADASAWDAAQRIGTAEAYRDYLGAYPQGSFRAAAQQRIEALTPRYRVCYVDDVRPPDAWLSLRTAPTRGQTIANMPSGTAMEMLGPVQGDWHQVRTQYGTGWVSWKVARWIRC
ncbi:caspase family protein [Pseudooceanicola sp. 200-1SW]|uniref:caspase family protein n=1 Tax=Pseudooceanicola sp. 200-1SW TaxID=3425949 RepID=UPI003D7FDB3C